MWRPIRLLTGQHVSHASVSDDGAGTETQLMETRKVAEVCKTDKHRIVFLFFSCLAEMPRCAHANEGHFHLSHTLK